MYNLEPGFVDKFDAASRIQQKISAHQFTNIPRRFVILDAFYSLLYVFMKTF